MFCNNRNIKISLSGKWLSKYSQERVLTSIWLILIALTVVSTSAAEQSSSGTIVVILVCSLFSIKGVLVTEWLMGLWHSAGMIRYLMLGYCTLLPLLITLAILYPELIKGLTAL